MWKSAGRELALFTFWFKTPNTINKIHLRVKTTLGCKSRQRLEGNPPHFINSRIKDWCSHSKWSLQGHGDESTEEWELRCFTFTRQSALIPSRQHILPHRLNGERVKPLYLTVPADDHNTLKSFWGFFCKCSCCKAIMMTQSRLDFSEMYVLRTLFEKRTDVWINRE